METATQEAEMNGTATQTERTFDEGYDYGSGLAENITEEQIVWELSVWRNMPYSKFADGTIQALASGLCARRSN